MRFCLIKTPQPWSSIWFRLPESLASTIRSSNPFQYLLESAKTLAGPRPAHNKMDTVRMKKIIRRSMVHNFLSDDISLKDWDSRLR